ncbi:MAG TPA: hypothetical protein EYP19_12780 [Desulfobacterales bacterium]|nr:hypothetical protein [Desulfobacterales bacterium]
MRCWIVVFLLTLASFRGVSAEDDIHGSADLFYRSSQTKSSQKRESARSLTQLYNLGLAKAFTSKVNFAGDVNVNVTENVTKTDGEKTADTTTTRLYPDMRLNVSNEYFDADAGYRLDERGLDILTAVSDEERLTTETWNHNFYTKLDKYPKVRLRYDQDRTFDRLPVHEIDTQTDRLFGSADYTYRFFNFYYDYTNEISDDYVKDSSRETNTHDGRIDFRKPFWNSKITSYGSYAINERKAETETKGESLEVAEQKAATAGLYIQDTTPASSTLNDRPDLIDGDKATTTGIDIGLAGNTYQNIGLELTSSTEIEKIYLYTTPAAPLLDADAFTWAVYSSTDNTAGVWAEITSSASFDYDLNQERFEISFTTTSARYFKVVNTANDGQALEVTEIEAYSIRTQAPYTTTDDVTTTHTIQANFGFRPFDWLSFTYDLNQDRQKNETDGDSTTTEQSRQYLSGLVEKAFQVHKYLEVRPYYQKRLEYEEGDTESPEEETTRRWTDTYRLYFVSSPLTTLATDLSLNHWVLREESETQSKTSSALLHIAAKLREGADLDIDGDITHLENRSTGSESTTRSIYSNLRLELTSDLTAEMEYNINYLKTETPSQDTTERTSNAEVTVYWRPSHDFYFRGSCGVDGKEGSRQNTSHQDYNLNWLLTDKVQLSMDYAIERNDMDTTSYSSDLSWNLSQVFTLRFGYDLSRQEADTRTDTQTVTADLSARF